VLHDALRFGVAGLAEVGPEAVVGREGDVAGSGHHDVGHDAALETAHAVGEQHPGHPAEELEALREHGQRRGLVLSAGEPDEAPAAPGQHGTEDLQPILLAPVEDEVLTRHRLPGSIGAAIAAMFGLGLGHGAAQRATRAAVSLGTAERQQALRADAAVGALHLRRDEPEDRVGDPGSCRAFGLWSAASFDDPPHGLVGRAAERRGGAIAAELGIGGEDVQLFPRSLHNGRPSGFAVVA